MPFDPDVDVPVLTPGYTYSQGQSGGYLSTRTVVNGGLGIAVTGTATVSVSLALGELGTGGDASGYVVGYEGGLPVLIDAALVGGGGGGSGTAIGTSFEPYGNISSFDVQNALQELDAEKAAVSHSHPQSDVTNLVSDLALKAPLANPVFTGNPQAPTASPGDNDTSVATTAFVTAAVAAAGGGTAASVTFSPVGTIAAATVQAAIAEAADEAVQVSGDTMTGQLILPAATASLSPLRIPHGTAHSTPTNGDIWTTSTSVYARVNGVTVDLAASGGVVTAASVTFSPAAGIAAIQVQAAIEEVVADVAAVYAPLASPTLTGDPKAPTPSTADNDTSIATTAFVKAQAYAPLASPTFTGTPNAVTGTDGVSSVQIATQAYVETAIGDRLLDTGDTMTGRLTLPAATAALSPLRIPHGTAPTGGALADGDIWTTATSMYARINGATVDLAAGGGGAPIDAPNFTTDVNLTGAALTTRLYYVSTGANVRWGWGADNSVEGGSESGSDFVMRAFTDAGVFYGDAFQIDRATLETSFWENVHFFEGADFAAPVQTKVTQRVRQAVNASASTTVNRLVGEYVDLTLDENITTFAVSNWPASGTMGQVHLAITFTGAFGITWPAAVKWPGGVAPTLTGVSGKADHIMLVSDSGGSVIWGFVMGQNYDA